MQLLAVAFAADIAAVAAGIALDELVQEAAAAVEEHHKTLDLEQHLQQLLGRLVVDELVVAVAAAAAASVVDHFEVVEEFFVALD